MFPQTYNHPTSTEAPENPLEPSKRARILKPRKHNEQAPITNKVDTTSVHYRATEEPMREKLPAGCTHELQAQGAVGLDRPAATQFRLGGIRLSLRREQEAGAGAPTTWLPWLQQAQPTSAAITRFNQGREIPLPDPPRGRAGWRWKESLTTGGRRGSCAPAGGPRA